MPQSQKPSAVADDEDMDPTVCLTSVSPNLIAEKKEMLSFFDL